jgi:hypothetical protein|tara:strand:- start:141 stop:599 length:459 start_codon:yes stop_codon:yes gene_type:complete
LAPLVPTVQKTADAPREWSEFGDRFDEHNVQPRYMWHDKQSTLIALNKKQPDSYGLGSCFEEYVRKKNNAKLPKNISYYKPQIDEHMDVQIADRPQWNAKITEKLMADQAKKCEELHDQNKGNLQKSNIDQLITKTKHDLDYVNNAMKVQNN